MVSDQFNERHIWLYNRTLECIEAIRIIPPEGDWKEYMSRCKELAEELLYAVTEWEKYYKD